MTSETKDGAATSVVDHEPARREISMEQALTPDFVGTNQIFAFRTSAVNLARWTITDIGVNFPADPVAVSVQVKFPPNADLHVSDNFSTVVSIATRSLIRVNTWRVDQSADPSINYAFDVIVVTR